MCGFSPAFLPWPAMFNSELGLLLQDRTIEHVYGSSAHPRAILDGQV